MKVSSWVLVALVGIAGLVSLDPALMGLSHTTPVLQAISLRGLLVAAAGVLTVLLAAVLVLVRLARGWVPQLVVLVVLVAVAGAGHFGVLWQRGLDSEPFPAKPADAVDVMTLNTLGNAGGIDGLIAVVAQYQPDVVALQEITPESAAQVAAALQSDYQFFTHTTGDHSVQGTALLVSAAMGQYQQIDAPATSFGAVWVTPVSGEGPPLLSVHPMPPIPGNVTVWESELVTLMQVCETEGVIMAGDFNATVDHAVLREAQCTDASVGVGGIGTWPAGRPAWLGAAIDHVLVDLQEWRPVAAQVLPAPDGGDHRAVLVRLQPESPDDR
ncbi:MAG: endonuclease/exonuclease/phosphatase family protein [Beutenbergiaceae bacterium]